MTRLLTLAFATSSVLHGVAYASLELAPRSEWRRAPVSSVLIETVRTDSEAAPEPTKPPPPDEPPLVRAPAARPSAPQLVSTAAERPVGPLDLSGLTLTNSDGIGDFAMPPGDGSPRMRPIAVATPRVVTPRASASPPASPPSDLVSSKDLSERPEPPRLDSLLRRLYPDEARRRGVSGSASLRVRIGADGRVSAVSLLSESFPGFGDACRKAVLGSSWSPPRDREGRRVETEVRYTCRFVVD